MEAYKCGVCERSNCKLWRLSHSAAIDLHCAKCLGIKYKAKFDLDANGMHIDDSIFKGFLTDQIKSYVPAVPVTNEDMAFHAYTAVPPDRVMWWRNLPN